MPSPHVLHVTGAPSHAPLHVTGAPSSAAETCTLLPGLFGILVQCLLFLVSATVLVIKKLRDHSDRTWFVFLLDGSKQILGAGFVHVVNMLIGTVLGDELNGHPCDWYWMNIMVDTTLGVFLEYMCLLGLTMLLGRMLGNVAVLRFGEYTNESGSVDLSIYAKQLGLWFCCIIGMKIVVLVLLVACGENMLSASSLILLLVSWNSRLKLFFVMVLTPACMNAFQLWLTDNFIQKGGLSFQGCCGCCRKVYGKFTGKESSELEDNASDDNLERQLFQDEEDHEELYPDGPRDLPSRNASKSSLRSLRSNNGSISEPLLVAAERNSVSSAAPAERHSLMSSRSQRSDNGNLSEPRFAEQNSVRSAEPAERNSVMSARSSLRSANGNLVEDQFELERAAYLESIEQIRLKLDNMTTAAGRERRDRECAEAQAKMHEEQMLDAQEKLYKAQQDMRLQREMELQLRDRLAIKEEREQQLSIRVQQLEFSYSTAGAAANAVFAAEVSAAAVAATSAVGSARRANWQAPSAIADLDLTSTIDEFLAAQVSAEAASLGARTSAMPGAPPSARFDARN